MSTWAEQIIVAVIIAGIIEMILPKGNNKKYVKAIIGVYILFTIISPVISKITDIDFQDIDNEEYIKQTERYQTMSQDLSNNNDKSVEEIYISNLKQDMKNKLQEKGYIAENIEVDIELKDEANYGKINKIILSVYKNEESNDDVYKDTSTNTISINKIEEVKIGNNVNNVNTNIQVKKGEIKNGEKNEIKEYLSGVYEINKKNIKINEN